MGPLNKEAELCYKHALQLLHSEQYDEAIAFFSKAITIEPCFADAFYYRGELLTMTGRIVEGNADLHKAKALRSGRLAKNLKSPRNIGKCNWLEVDSVYDRVFIEETDPGHDETVNFDNEIYDYVFSDDTLETDKLWDGLIDESNRATSSPAIFEFLGGGREEVASIQLFQPTPREIFILDDDAGEANRIVPLSELSCIRVARLPAGCEQKKDPASQIEIIETRDGNIYHEYIQPRQSLDGCLLGFSTKADTHLPYTLFPEVNIKLRYQDRYLGDILLEKRFIADEMLKNALEEHQLLRSMPLGKIVARQANILYAEIETSIAKAQSSGMMGLKTGEILLNAGLVSEEQILDALQFQEKLQSKKLGEFLIEKGILREKELYISLADKFRIPFIDLRQQKVSKKILNMLPREVVLQFTILPIAQKDSTLVVATASPDVSAIRESIMQHTVHKRIEFVLAQPTHLKNVINILYQDRRKRTESV